MTAPTLLKELAGKWRGLNRLWLSPDRSARESETTAIITLAAQGKFVILHYTWADEGQPQDGLLIIGQQESKPQVNAAWIDSWHVGNQYMPCEGVVLPDGAITLFGKYAAPPGPDWGWKIVIQQQAGNEQLGTQLRMVMYNITPEASQLLAVEATYSSDE